MKGVISINICNIYKQIISTKPSNPEFFTQLFFFFS